MAERDGSGAASGGPPERYARPPEEPAAEWREIATVAEEPLGRREPLRAALAIGAVAAIIAAGLLASQASTIMGLLFPTPSASPAAVSPSPSAAATAAPASGAPSGAPASVLASAPASGAPPTTPSPAPLIAVVAEGDTLESIAAHYGVTLAALLAANPSLGNPWRIAPGDRLVIPPPDVPVQGNHDGSETYAWDAAHCNATGWASDPDDRSRPVVVRILVDDTMLMMLLANQYRQDIAQNVGGSGYAAFDVSLVGRVVPDVAHEVRVQAQDLETQEWVDLNNTPRTLTCSKLIRAAWPSPSPGPATQAPSPTPPAGATAAPSSAPTVAPPQLVVADPFTMEVPADWRTRRGLPYPNGDQTLVYAGPLFLPSECEQTPQGGLCHPWPIVVLEPGGSVIAVRAHGAPGEAPPAGGVPLTVGGSPARRMAGSADEGCAAIGGSRSITVVVPAAAGTTAPWYSFEACLAGTDTSAAERRFATIVDSVEIVRPLP